MAAMKAALRASSNHYTQLTSLPCWARSTPQTAAHSRAFGGSLATMGWPARVEERNAGHMVDWTFMAHGIAWLREKKR